MTTHLTDTDTINDNGGRDADATAEFPVSYSFEFLFDGECGVETQCVFARCNAAGAFEVVAVVDVEGEIIASELWATAEIADLARSIAAEIAAS